MSELVAAYLPEFIILIFVVINLVFSLFAGTSVYRISKWTTLLGIVLALGSTIYLQIETSAGINLRLLPNIKS